MAITVTRATAIKRTYPHLSQITDPMAQQTIRLLWDRIWALEERLQASEATISELVSGHNSNESTITTVQKNSEMALSLAQRVGEAAGSETGGGGSTPLPGGGDGGAGNIGCSAAGATGHDTGGLLNAIRAGQIVCGTGNEYPALKNATADLPTRITNATELIARMIWHLRLAGFTAGQQRNPSGIISDNKLCVVVDGVTRAYDVLVGKSNFSAPMSTAMNEVAPADLVDYAGIPD
jgi:hypothetical protein